MKMGFYATILNIKENNLSHPTNIISESMRKLQYKFPWNSWSHFLLADPIML